MDREIIEGIIPEELLAMQDARDIEAGRPAGFSGALLSEVLIQKEMATIKKQLL